MKFWLCLLINLLFSIFYCSGQNLNQRFKNFTNNDGLSQNTVNSIIQDSYGYLWIGTIDGLNRYDGTSFKVYKNNPVIKTSLPSSAITTLLYSRDSTIWVGTRYGLAIYIEKYDRFETIKEIDKSNTIHALYEDSQGTIWVSADKVYIKEKTENQFKPFQFSTNVMNMTLGETLTKKDTVSNHDFTVTAFQEDSHQNLWVGFQNHGVIRYDLIQKSFKTYSYRQEIPNGIPSNEINQISASKSSVWFATARGLSKYDVKSDTFKNYFHDDNHPKSLPFNFVNAVTISENQRIWVNTDQGGLSLFNGDNSFINFQNSPSDPNSISVNTLKCIYEDNLNNLWIGTDNGGLCKYVPYTPFQHYKQDISKDTYLSSNLMRKIITDNKGFIWAATYSEGLNRINPVTQEVDIFTYKENDKNSLAENKLTQILQDALGNYWIGHQNNGLNKLEITYGNEKQIVSYKISHFVKEDNNRSLAGLEIMDIVEENDSTIWIGCYGGISRLNPYTNQIISYRLNSADVKSPENNIRGLAIDSKNRRLWGGTDKGGIWMFDTSKEIFTKRYMHHIDSLNTISSNKINTLLYDEKGNSLWVGTAGYGVNKINLLTDSVEIFSTNNGMSNDYIYGILQDNNSNLWISTNEGINKLTYNPFSIEVFSQQDGLQNNEFNIAAFYKDKSTGELFFGGINGFNIFHPDSIRPSKISPEIAFTNFKLFNKTENEYGSSSVLKQHINTIDTIHLSYKDNIFSIEFAALHLKEASRNRYKYMMEGLNNEWISLETENSVTFTNLDPTVYCLKIKASNSDGIWTPKARELYIIISPPWWETWWFRTISSVLFLFSGVIFYKYRMYKVQKQKKKLEKTVQERTMQLQQKQEEILTQNEELRQTQEELQTQRDFIEEKNIVLETKNKHIEQSILAAQEIQDATLPTNEVFEQNFKDYFIFYKPRDIVSGDFYWVDKVDNSIWLVVADCTGHGVPGAFMTLLGVNFLDKLIKQDKLETPAQVLEQLDFEIRKRLKQKETGGTRGMDLSILKIDIQSDNKVKVVFSAAKSLMYVYETLHQDLTEYKGDRIAIGGEKSKEVIFSNKEICIKKGTKIYLGSDGYQDQNNSLRKSFSRRRFKELITTIAQKNSMNAQKQELRNTLKDYMNDTTQRDDILVLGIQF